MAARRVGAAAAAWAVLGLGWGSSGSPLMAQELPSASKATSQANDARRTSEQETVVVEVLVTGVAGNSLYVDQGYAGGLAVGDELRLWPIGGTPLAARVESVSRDQARLSLIGGGSVLGVPVGSRGEARVPRSRVAVEAPPPDVQASTSDGEASTPAPTSGPVAPPTKPRPGERPTGLPWTAPQVEWEEDQPLLAEAQALQPEERRADWSGRVFIDGSSSRARAPSRTASSEVNPTKRTAKRASSASRTTGAGTGAMTWASGWGAFSSVRSPSSACSTAARCAGASRSNTA
jgi:hypothetical protein